MNIIQILQDDYQRFPIDQTYHIYAEDVYFQDPLNQFWGIKKYQKMIGLIKTFFRETKLDLHDINQSENLIITKWTLSWTAPVPWQPRMTITGWSELKLNPEGLIISHIDYWNCSIWDVIKQLWPVKSHPEK